MLLERLLNDPTIPPQAPFAVTPSPSTTPAPLQLLIVHCNLLITATARSLPKSVSNGNAMFASVSKPLQGGGSQLGPYLGKGRVNVWGWKCSMIWRVCAFHFIWAILCKTRVLPQIICYRCMQNCSWRKVTVLIYKLHVHIRFVWIASSLLLETSKIKAVTMVRLVWNTTVGGDTFYSLHFLLVTLFTRYTFYSWHFLLVTLFTRYTFYSLHFLLVTLFTRYTFYSWHFLLVTLFTRYTFYSWHFLLVTLFTRYTFYSLHFLLVTLFTRYTFYSWHFLLVTLFTRYTFYSLHFLLVTHFTRYWLLKSVSKLLFPRL